MPGRAALLSNCISCKEIQNRFYKDKHSYKTYCRNKNAPLAENRALKLFLVVQFLLTFIEFRIILTPHLEDKEQTMRDVESVGLTKQRQAILQVIRESDEHLTANQIFEDARRLLPGISFATVYNSLRYLKQEGLIGEVRFGADTTRYDRKLTRHDHALCINCGRLVDLELSIPVALVEEASALSKFDAKSVELTLRGLCPKCRK